MKWPTGQVPRAAGDGGGRLPTPAAGCGLTWPRCNPLRRSCRYPQAARAIQRTHRPSKTGRATHTSPSFSARSRRTVAPVAVRLCIAFRRTNARNRHARCHCMEPVADAASAATGPSGGPLRPAHAGRSHLKRGFRRDVKVPATNEATNNPAGRARHSARGRHALASPCRTP